MSLFILHIKFKQAFSSLCQYEKHENLDSIKKKVQDCLMSSEKCYNTSLTNSKWNNKHQLYLGLKLIQIVFKKVNLIKKLARTNQHET